MPDPNAGGTKALSKEDMVNFVKGLAASMTAESCTLKSENWDFQCVNGKEYRRLVQELCCSPCPNGGAAVSAEDCCIVYRYGEWEATGKLCNELEAKVTKALFAPPQI